MNLTEFFSSLNSEKYGCILDEIFNVNKGIKQLKRQNVSLPEEISGLFIVILKFVQFVKDFHINPIMKTGEILSVKSGDIIGCEYYGSPFPDEEQEKSVRVLSPGWVYADKEIQISRPKLMEVTENEY